MKITLDAGEMAVANVLAAMRHGVNRHHGVVNGRMGPQSDFETDLDGVVAEIAFCRWKNVCPDLSITPRSGGEDAIFAGKHVDIKATRREDGRLLAVATKEIEDADIYVLAIVKGNQVRFAGWAFAMELISKDNLTDLGHGPTYALAQSRLRVFKE